MNKSKETYFTIKVYANQSQKDELVEEGVKYLGIIGKGKSARYSMVTDNISLIPNDALITVNRTHWQEAGVKFSEIIKPTKVADSHDGKDWHYEYIKSNLTKISGKQFKRVVLS